MFNPAIHTATNKPIGLIGKPVDARTYFYDTTNFVYRAYVSTAEVLAYLNTASDRVGQFSIIINTGGSLSAGVITGGTNTEWWFKNGVLDANLVVKTGGGVEIPFDEPFTALSSKSIDWQTDIPTGQTLTYAQLRGNALQDPVVYAGNAGAAKTRADTTVIITYTNSSETLIDTVSLDWGFSTNGKIAW